MRKALTGVARGTLASLTALIFLLSMGWQGVQLATATDDITTNPKISFNPLEPVSIASGFDLGSGHPVPAAFVTTRRLPSCNQERIVRVNRDGTTTNFATLPPRDVLDGCSETDIAVSTNGTSPFATKGYLFNIFVSRIRNVYRVSAAGGAPSLFATLDASGTWGTCERIVSIAFDPGPVGSGALFNGDLLAACKGADETAEPAPAAHIFRINASGVDTYVDSVDDSIGRIAFAPKNWLTSPVPLFQLLVFERDLLPGVTGDAPNLVTISDQGVTGRIYVDQLQAVTGEVAVYAVPPRFCNFNGGVLIATDPANKRLIRFTETSFVGDQGAVLLVTSTGERWRGDTAASGFQRDDPHAVPFEDADWCGLLYSALAVKPSSVSFDNNGIATGNISVVLLSFLGPPLFDPVAELGPNIDSIRCGATGSEKPFKPTSTQDDNGDDIQDLHGNFRAEGAGLSRGQTPVCSGHLGTTSHDAGFW